MRNAECHDRRRSVPDPSFQFRIPHSAIRIRGGAVTVWDSDRVTRALGVSGPRGLRFPGGVATDTRHLTPGTLFVALQGDRFDAHAFLDQAKAQGAAAAVVRQGTRPVQGWPWSAPTRRSSPWKRGAGPARWSPAPGRRRTCGPTQPNSTRAATRG